MNKNQEDRYKKCSHCKLVKDFSEFYLDNTRIDKHQAQCKSCTKITTQKHKKKNQQVEEKLNKTQSILLNILIELRTIRDSLNLDISKEL